MDHNKKISYKILISGIICLIALVLIFLPWKPTLPTPRNITQQPWQNVAQADMAAWLTEVQGGNFNCPLAAINQVTDRRICPTCAKTRAFWQAAINIIRAQPTPQARVIKAAQLAVSCRIHFGCCGRTTDSIFVLAGVPGGRRMPLPTETSSGCLFSGDTGCALTLTPKRNPDGETMAISGANVRRTQNRNCDVDGGHPAPNCFASGFLAARAVYQELTRSLTTTWPDRWANYLEPGDKLIIYNGNTSRIGSHAVIFIGWQDEARGEAYIVEGNARSWIPEHTAGYPDLRARLNTVCLKRECNPYVSLTYVYSPNQNQETTTH